MLKPNNENIKHEDMFKMQTSTQIDNHKLRKNVPTEKSTFFKKWFEVLKP